ncbi:MAG: polyphosphate polymerase domain-containing protein [Erysipelotrichaceae bacterium]|jgi:hypothetical protein|nr:polyphosphate polymerase domain-containing protein [Erysipelotrichaceae bacterium]MBQ3963147.1 polyphosphate polymerase domain-containing protein [Erysipelotrichaceae bacterium]MBR4610552.1 polyphosphate polymerase domain-containing protein [Erysipelotrichaceae bacterium]MBR6260254.1 polyphosphate polymerase domain-containing protein [Erysipelotrichaceae bacterium]
METFQRFEKKYLLNDEQYASLMEQMKEHIVPDKFYQTMIRSLYYDTDDHELVRRSIEKPEYKEKLRARSYGDSKGNDEVFVELKKKYDGIVYKRRTQVCCKDVLNDIATCHFKDSQVGKEILYALNYYGKLSPSIYIGCKRTSYVGKKEEDLRITFDKEISYRTRNLSLQKDDDDDRPLTDKTVMELKIKDAMPLWLADILDENKVYPQSYSKVGNAFLKQLQGEML